jgi:hypothetical protein
MAGDRLLDHDEGASCAERSERRCELADDAVAERNLDG